jgi:hypothetical protein
MNEIPEINQEQSRPSLPERILLLISNSAWIRMPIAWALALVLAVGASYLILVPTAFLPDYIALPLTFALGMILWGLLIGFPKNKKATKRFWTFSALIWGGAVCLVYADALRQFHHILTGWYWIGVGLQLLAAILGVFYYLTDRAKKGKSR